MYLYVRSVPDAILRGELKQEDCPSYAEKLATSKDLVAYAHESFRTADRAIAQMEERHMRALLAAQDQHADEKDDDGRPKRDRGSHVRAHLSSGEGEV